MRRTVMILSALVALFVLTASQCPQENELEPGPCSEECDNDDCAGGCAEDDPIKVDCGAEGSSVSPGADEVCDAVEDDPDEISADECVDDCEDECVEDCEECVEGAEDCEETCVEDCEDAGPVDETPFCTECDVDVVGLAAELEAGNEWQTIPDVMLIGPFSADNVPFTGFVIPADRFELPGDWAWFAFPGELGAFEWFQPGLEPRNAGCVRPDMPESGVFAGDNPPAALPLRDNFFGCSQRVIPGEPGTAFGYQSTENGVRDFSAQATFAGVPNAHVNVDPDGPVWYADMDDNPPGGDSGLPIAGDFNGDGENDLDVWDDDAFRLDFFP